MTILNCELCFCKVLLFKRSHSTENKVAPDSTLGCQLLRLLGGRIDRKLKDKHGSDRPNEMTTLGMVLEMEYNTYVMKFCTRALQNMCNVY